MRELKRCAIALLGALAATGLVACSRSAAEPPGTPIAESEVPRVRAGLWDYAWSIDGGPTRERRYCDSGGPVMHRGAGLCTNVRYQRVAGGGLMMDMDCSEKDSRFHLHKAFRGDPQQAFSTDGYSYDLPKPVLVLDVSRIHASQRYLGACPAGMAPKKP